MVQLITGQFLAGFALGILVTLVMFILFAAVD